MTLKVEAEENDESDPLCCKICKKRFTKEKFLRQHMFFHSFDTKNQCKVCSERFKNSKELLAHKFQHKENPLFCKKCNLSFTSRTLRNQHQKSVHTLKPKFECLVCSQTFKKDFNLQKHAKIHTNLQGFKCKKCDSGNFKNYQQLKVHSYRHREKIFKCLFCIMAFRTVTELKSHEKSHSTDIADYYHCDICGRQSHFKFTIKRHVLTHLTELKFECTICHKFYKTKVHLKAHTRKVHCELIRFQCEICQKKCCSASNLKTHQLVHSNERSFKCHICGNAYKAYSGLRKHQMKFHKITTG
jgi:KRAB domain-containing zinc finger protein